MANIRLSSERAFPASQLEPFVRWRQSIFSYFPFFSSHLQANDRFPAYVLVWELTHLIGKG